MATFRVLYTMEQPLGDGGFKLSRNRRKVTVDSDDASKQECRDLIKASLVHDHKNETVVLLEVAPMAFTKKVVETSPGEPWEASKKTKDAAGTRAVELAQAAATSPDALSKDTKTEEEAGITVEKETDTATAVAEPPEEAGEKKRPKLKKKS